jgi:lipooligosaccharide transport system ATP-binding protein
VDFGVFQECFGFSGERAGKTSTMKRSTPRASDGRRVSVVGSTLPHEREVKRRIGVVPQENNLDEGSRSGRNAVYGRYFDCRARSCAEGRRAARVVQLTEKARRGRGALGGMKRRLSSRAPSFNDPTRRARRADHGPRPQARHLVWDKLRELARAGKT